MHYRNWHTLGSDRVKTRAIAGCHTGAHREPTQYVSMDLTNGVGKHLILEMTCDEMRALIRRLHERLEWIEQPGEDDE